MGATATSSVVPGAGTWAAEGEGRRSRVGVVVVHGITGNPHSTRPLGEALNDAGFTVEVPRLPGHGTSVADMAGTRYGDWYGSLRATVDDLAGRTDEIVLVGQSMGATLCLDLAGRHPDEVAGVVSINGQILDPDQPLARVSGLLQYLVPRLPRDLAGLPSRDIARPDADERAYTWVPARPVHSLLQALPEIRHRLPRVTAPLLVLYSLQDHTVPPRNSKALSELVGSEEVSVVPLERSYHVAILDWDAPLVAEETVAFAARVSGT